MKPVRVFRLIRPLYNKDGSVAVDPKKYPHLHASLERGRKTQRERWERVVELRRKGLDDSAERLAKKLLGVKGKPMTEEKREYLDRYKREHAEEIKQKRELRLAARRRTKALLTTGRRRK